MASKAVVVRLVIAAAFICVIKADEVLAPNKGYVNTPIGRMPPHCVHTVKSGSEIFETDAGVVVVKHPR